METIETNKTKYIGQSQVNTLIENLNRKYKFKSKRDYGGLIILECGHTNIGVACQAFINLGHELEYVVNPVPAHQGF